MEIREAVCHRRLSGPSIAISATLASMVCRTLGRVGIIGGGGEWTVTNVSCKTSSNKYRASFGEEVDCRQSAISRTVSFRYHLFPERSVRCQFFHCDYARRGRPRASFASPSSCFFPLTQNEATSSCFSPSLITPLSAVLLLSSSFFLSVCLCGFLYSFICFTIFPLSLVCYSCSSLSVIKKKVKTSPSGMFLPLLQN